MWKTIWTAAISSVAIRCSVALLSFALSDVISETVAKQLCMFAIEVFLQCWMISWLFELRPLKAFQAWLPTILLVLPAVVLALLVRHFLFEAFVTPTNSMAPTILGIHAVGKCDRCGEECYGAPGSERFRGVESYAICENYHSVPTKELSRQNIQGDRILVSKFTTPKRWDVIVFHLPENPSVLYIKRLVGMPNEEVYVHDGKLWIDGEPQTAPNHLGEIEYESEFPSYAKELSGTKANPAKLANDEYFVLGDFTHRAMDSRFWRRGVEGRQPYAVPASYVKGLVTHVFWPPSRVRVIE